MYVDTVRGLSGLSTNSGTGEPPRQEKDGDPWKRVNKYSNLNVFGCLHLFLMVVLDVGAFVEPLRSLDVFFAQRKRGATDVETVGITRGKWDLNTRTCDRHSGRFGRYLGWEPSLPWMMDATTTPWFLGRIE